MLLMIAIAVAVWALVVTGVVALCAMARRGDEPQYEAAARMHALRRVAPGCAPARTAGVSARPRRLERPRGARALR